MRYLSVCSGMEAASVAWEPLGWKAVGFSEIEPFPCAILKHRFPNTPNHGSLTEYKQWPLEPGAIDLLVGGCPCQSFSVAGLRRGMEDPRGNLTLVFLGLADKLKPRWIVFENVPGLLSSAGGRDFGSFLGALVELGYGFAYRVLDAQHFGVPQRRRRVFVVACLGDWRAPAEVLLESDCVRRDIKKGRAKGQDASSSAEGGVGADHPEGCWWDGGQVSQTLDAVLQKGQTMPEKNCFPAVLQPYTASSFAQYAEGVGTVRASGGDLGGGSETLLAQPIPFRKSKRACSTTDNETRVEADASNTLNNFDLGDTRTTHAVVEPIAIQGTIIGRSENAGPQGTGATEGGPMFTLTKTDVHGVAHCSDVAPTVTSSGPPYSRTGNERVEAEALAVTFQPGNLRRDAGADPSTTTTLKASAGDQMPHVAYPVIPIHDQATRHAGKRGDKQDGKGNGLGVGKPGDPMNTLTRGDHHDVATVYSFDSLASNSMKSSNPISGCREVDLSKTIDTTNPCPSKNQGGLGILQNSPMAVRRLTPVECERLQGFPDNWSRISWKGKPEDQCPDGPRYKACGNSMAVPVMRWIGERIAAADAKHFPHA